MAPTTASGKIYAMVDYDYDDDVPTDITSFMQNKSTASCNVWDSLKLDVDITCLDQVMKWRYTEAGKPGAEARTMYGGYVVLCTSGLGQAITYDVHVDYSVELDIPCPFLSSYSFANATPSTPKIATVSYATPPANQSACSLVWSPITVSAPFRSVTPGAAGTPALQLFGQGVLLAAELIKYSGILGGATYAYGSDNTKTPINFVTGKGRLDFAAFNDAGTLLTNSVYAVNVAGKVCPVNYSAGCDGGFNPADAASPVTANADFDVAVLKLAYPALKYVVPYLMVAASNYLLGAGTQTEQMRLVF